MAKATLAEDTAQAIIRYIIENRLKPGDKLPTEPIFMEKLGVGRGTLREGIKLLAARNILDIRQGAGSYVSHRRGIPDDPLGLTFIEEDSGLIVDLLDVRLLFEPHVVRLAAARATEAEKVAILEQAAEVERCIAEGESYVAADTCFHRLIAEASGNKVFGNLTYVLNTSIAQNIAITQDYGLAAMCLSKGAIVLHQDGKQYTEENISGLLEFRAVSKKIRRSGGRLKGNPKRTAEQDTA